MKAHNFNHFSIYRNLPIDRQRKEEVLDIYPFFMRVQDFIEVTDVNYGADPPDFVLTTINGHSIGIELTKLNPCIFSRGGYTKRKDFADWKKEEANNPQPRSEFEWGRFTLRESLEAFKYQFQRKAERLKAVSPAQKEQWLLFHIDSGSPMGCLIGPVSSCTAQGREEEYLNYTAKYLYEVNQITKTPSPFTYVILSCGIRLLAFATKDNPLGFPIPDNMLLVRGAQASESYVDWSSTLSSVTLRQTLGEENSDTWFKKQIEW